MLGMDHNRLNDYVIEEITLSDSDNEIEIVSDCNISNQIPKKEPNFFKLHPIDLKIVKRERFDAVFTVPDDDEPAEKKFKKNVQCDSLSTLPDLNRIRNVPSSSSSPSPPPSLVTPTTISRHETGISIQKSPISDARLKQLLNHHQTLISIPKRQFQTSQSPRIKCEFSSTSVWKTPEVKTTILSPEINGVVSESEIDEFENGLEKCHLPIGSSTSFCQTPQEETEIQSPEIDAEVIKTKIDNCETENCQFQIDSGNCEIKSEIIFEPVNERCVTVSRHSRHSRINIFEKFEDLGVDLSIYKRENGCVKTMEQLLPFPARYFPVLPVDSDVREFDENIMATLTSEIDGAIKGIAAFTSKKFRPPRQLFAQLFNWTIDSKSESELNFRLNVMRQIHRLHGFPKSLSLWDFLEQACFRDSFEKTPLVLAIKSCVLDFICSILEADFYSSRKIFDKFGDKTQAYKLLSARTSFGNIKTIIAWLEDTIKVYDEINKSNNSLFLRVQHGHHYYLIIESLQKLLALSICASEEPKEHANFISGEVVSSYKRLNHTQQHLFITGIKSNVLLMVTVEKLLQEIPITDADEFYSLCNWDKIINHYFKMFSKTNMEMWDRCDLQRNTLYFLLLLQCYIEESQSELHDRSGYLAILTDELEKFQRQIETFLIDVPEEVTFLFCLIKLSIAL